MTQGFRSLSLGLVGAVAVLFLGTDARADLYKGYEQPAYRLVLTDGNVELRDYAPHLVAEVHVAGSRQSAIRRGFVILADYIFGRNAGGAKVEMTVPVSQVAAGDAWAISFVMPSEYDRSTLPDPDHPAIRLVEVPAERHLVVRFSGRATASALAAETRRLLVAAAARGLTPSGSPRYHFYDDPFTLPWLRRNEVSVPVR